MKEIGQKIKEARQKQGIKIEEVQRVTKIRSKYLKAIEEGDFEVVPQEVFLKGFLRVYANYVGLDGEKMLKKYSQSKALQDEEEDKRAPKVKENSSIESLLELIQNNWQKMTAAIVGLILIISVGLGLYKSGIVIDLAKTVRDLRRRPAKEEKLTFEEDQVEVKEEEQKEKEQTVTKEEANLEKEKEGLAEKLNISIEAIESSWVKIIVDGKVVFEKILDSGEKKSWHVDKKFKLLTANAAGVKVISEGEVFGPFGKHGEVITKEFKLKSER